MNLRAAEKKLESKFAELKAQWSKQGPYRTIVSIKGRKIALEYYATFTPLEHHAFNFLKKQSLFDTWFFEIKMIMKTDFEKLLNSIFDEARIVSFDSKMSEDYDVQTTIIEMDKDLENLIIKDQVVLI
ncbi:hypothetical protein AV654_17925 [Paenibacillus elgii]|uniref:Uncharacterized protein n=1 Tax=Paenibacillus elgii TaxID=189691 RepID=A0A163YFH7_9BACL|nr:hypothetical protein [Paenibacillus elgii]KZE79348.1 hypothetical protein AV654_17925 [Paenibacillus elgii]